MRLAGQEKLGYYPTPQSEVKRIASHFRVHRSQAIRLLDPCAGMGEAVYGFMRAINDYRISENLYLVELSPDRYEQILTLPERPDAPITYKPEYNRFNTLLSDWKNVKVSHGSMSAIWLNPPYDWDDDESEEAKQKELIEGVASKKVRLETVFLADCQELLTEGGILINIVPEMMLGYLDFRKILAQRFKDFTIYRFAPEEYPAFKQIVILARRRSVDILQSDEEFKTSMAMLEKLSKDGVKEYDPYNSQTYNFPEFKHLDRFTFRGAELHGDDLAKIVHRTGGATTTNGWKDLRSPGSVPFRPLLSPRIGHAATLLASGMMGTIRSGDKVLKGNTKIGAIAYDEKGFEIDPKEPGGQPVRKRVTTFITEINELDIAKREFTTYADPKALTLVLSEHASRLTEIIFERYKPLYDGAITEPQMATLNKLLLYKKLPGVKKAGLLPLQKTLAAAAAMAARKYGFSIVVGEMGIGKTAISLATLELLHTDAKGAYPAIVMAPTHLVEKWIRECKDVIPDSHPFEAKSMAAVDQFFKNYSDPAKKGILVLSKERAKMGPGIIVAHNNRRTPLRYSEIDLVTGNTVKRKNLGALKPVTCPKCGAVMLDKEGEPVYSLSPGKKEFCKAKWAVPMPVSRWADVKKGHMRTQMVVCDEPLYQYGTKPKVKPDAGQNFLTSKAQPKRHTWPLARYIAKRYKFGTYIADEMHKYKGKSTDQGRAFHNLARAAKYTIGLTGTLFGGKSTDLYFMFYRLYPRAFQREGFRFNQEGNFSTKYGRMEYTYAVDHTEAEYGKTTGMERKPISVREVPGISPAIYEYVLPFCIFAKVDDLGVSMPRFDEFIERIPMAEMQREQYDKITEYIQHKIKSGYSSFSKEGMREAVALLGVFLQTGLCRPNSGFRNELVWWKPVKGGNHVPLLVPHDLLPEALPPRSDDEEEAETINVTADTTSDMEEATHAYEEIGEEGDEEEGTARKIQKEADAIAPSNFVLPPGMNIPAGWAPAILHATQYTDEMNPKEEWLIEKITAQVKRGRRSIVYISQTSTRNIQPRIAGLIQRAGFTVEILPDGNAKGREKWIKAHPCQVLITNPMKVETGMDLVDFQSIIFYEMVYSLFTFWQAVRRVWRLGQSKPVEVLYAVYENSIEEKALALMGQKQQAAHLLYGDSAQTAVSASVSNQDFMAELVQKILTDQKIETDGISLLGAQLSAGEQESQPEAQEGVVMSPQAYQTPLTEMEGWRDYFVPNLVEYLENHALNQELRNLNRWITEDDMEMFCAAIFSDHFVKMLDHPDYEDGLEDLRMSHPFPHVIAMGLAKGALKDIDEETVDMFLGCVLNQLAPALEGMVDDDADEGPAVVEEVVISEPVVEEAPKPKATPERKKLTIGDTFKTPGDTVVFTMVAPPTAVAYKPGKATIFVRRESDKQILHFKDCEDFELRTGFELCADYLKPVTTPPSAPTLVTQVIDKIAEQVKEIVPAMTVTKTTFAGGQALVLTPPARKPVAVAPAPVAAPQARPVIHAPVTPHKPAPPVSAPPVKPTATPVIIPPKKLSVMEQYAARMKK
jgi:tRNA1(Val) A37 N6-methylase TrmN6